MNGPKKNREKDACPEHIFVGDFDGDGAAELANYGAPLNGGSSGFAVFHFAIVCGVGIPDNVEMVIDERGSRIQADFLDIAGGKDTIDINMEAFESS